MTARHLPISPKRLGYAVTGFTQFPEIKGLAANDIYSLYTTKAGAIWIGATSVGAYRYDRFDARLTRV